MKQLMEKYKEISYVECTDEDSHQVDIIIRRDDFLFIFLFEKGSGVHTIGRKDFSVQEMQVHIVFPGQMQDLKLFEPSVFHLITVCKYKYTEIIGGLQIPSTVCQKYPVVNVSKDIFSILIKEFRDIAFEINEKSCVMKQIIDTKAKIILQSIGREIRRNFGDIQLYDQHPVLFMFIVLIKKHYKEERMVSFYAKNLGITANYLNVLCKKYLKQTASSVIDSLTIPMIKEEIVVSDDLLINIAYEYCFQNYIHFSRYFKKHVGMSPMAYRKKNY